MTCSKITCQIICEISVRACTCNFEIFVITFTTWQNTSNKVRYTVMDQYYFSCTHAGHFKNDAETISSLKSFRIQRIKMTHKKIT